MTPAARIATAIDMLDQYLSGAPLEKTLTNWARGARYAGSKDRAAVRDIVFQCVRCRDSYALLGGSLTGRGLVIGHVRCDGGTELVPGGETRLADMFSGDRFSAAPLSNGELAHVRKAPDDLPLDLPDWLIPELKASLGDRFEAVCAMLKTRAPVFVRVNLQRGTREAAQASLKADGIESCPHELAETALEITSNPRRVAQSRAYESGLIELQDAASQAVVAEIETQGPVRILDYCAGGGGKALALADRPGITVFAHDADADRMRDLPLRAGRAGVEIALLTTDQIADHAPFDIVVTDVPCSGSGAWRRAVEGKWSLSQEKLQALHQVQAEILDQAARLVRPGGCLAYMTCSLLKSENTVQIENFAARHSSFELQRQRQLTPLDGGDGFYVAILKHLSQ